MSAMQKTCAWCKTELDNSEYSSPRRAPVSHGICELCSENFLTNPDLTLREFLDQIEEPLLVMESDIRVLTGNRTARDKLGKSLPAMQHHRMGGLIGCKNAARPGGCGLQQECQACRLRTSVFHTMRTGRGHQLVEATQQILSEGQINDVVYQISTEKVGGCVLMRLDRVRT